MTDKPLVLLDVDGVLNLGLFASSTFRARMMHHQAPHWVNRWTGERHYSTRIFLDRRWGPMVRSIAEAGADLVWATRWEEMANEFIGPLLGLPELPVITVHRTVGKMIQPKYMAVTEWAAEQERPWAWLDDELGELAGAKWIAEHLGDGVPFLPVLVDRERGLAQEDADKVRNWLHSL